MPPSPDKPAYSEAPLSVEDGSNEVIEYAPEGWMTRNAIAKKFGKADATIQDIITSFDDLSDDDKGKYQSQSGATDYYSPEIIARIEAELDKLPSPAPEGWMTKTAIAKKFGKSKKTKKIQKIITSFGELSDDDRRVYQPPIGGPTNFYSPEIIARIEAVLDKFPDPAPEGWMTKTAVVKKYGRAPDTIQDIITSFGDLSDDDKGKYQSLGGPADFYSPEIIARIEAVLNARPDQAPEGWMVRSAIADKLERTEYMVNKIIDSFGTLADDDHGKYQSPSGVTDYYSPEIFARIEAELSKAHRPAPEGWMTLYGISKEFGRIRAKIEDIIISLGPLSDDDYGEYQSSGDPTNFYSPEIIARIKAELDKLPGSAPQGWMPKKAIERKFGKDGKLIQKIINSLGPLSGDDRRKYSAQGGATDYYSPEIIARIEVELSKAHRPAPEGWMTKTAIANEFGKADAIQDIVTSFGQLSADQHGKYQSPGGSTYYYSPEIIARIEAVLDKFPDPAPEGWMTINAITEKSGKGHDTIKNIIASFGPLSDDDKGEYHSQGGATNFYSPAIVNRIREVLETNEADKEAPAKLVESFEHTFANPEELQNLKNLISLFGSAQVLDVLFALYPEYKGVPIEKVKSQLGEYLGNYLLTPAPLSLDSLSGHVELLGEQSLRDGLVEVVKSDALIKVLEKGETKIIDNGVEFLAYFERLREKAAEINNPHLDSALLEAEKFYISLLDFDAPESVVDALRPDREFPDVYQRINIKELENKKRILIADEMGSGKSASAIIAKEYLGVQTALILVPSNALETWRTYLSNQRNEEGKPVGYFKEQPRILVVTHMADLQAIDRTDYDYILCSHERLTQEYTDELEKLNCGMVIVDEVHKLKNVREGVRAENLLRLTAETTDNEKYVAMLSGTPVPNKVEDVAMLLKLMHPNRFAETDSKALVRAIIQGDLLDLRQLLLPRLQMKSLGDYIAMPAFTKSIETIELRADEAEVYQVLLEEDELTPTEKIQLLQKFILNPKLLDMTPGLLSSKLEQLNQSLEATFETKDRVVLFVNDYIEGVIRGDDNILEDLSVPEDVSIAVVHGGVSQAERLEIQKRFQAKGERILLVVSGATADVAVDYSAGEKIIHYNEPWTEADKRQQQARVLRPGVGEGVDAVTLITKATIEEGKHEYIQLKDRAITKLLSGIPITELEKELLEKTEVADTQDLSVNSELAEYYFSSFDKLNRIFASVKEIGVDDFASFLERYGAEYAQYYEELGSRSYQSNASRVVATIIEAMIEEQGVQNPQILDVASGPEMLWRHSSDALRSGITSMDMNEAHFSTVQGDREPIVGSMTDIPVADNSQDFVNLSLSLHYTKLIPTKGKFERLEVLKEMSRVLRVGGRGIINMVYSLDFRDPAVLKDIGEKFGLRLVETVSGMVNGGSGYESRIVTFEKESETPKSIETVIEGLTKEQLDGFKLNQTERKLVNQRTIIKDFTINGKSFSVTLNHDDRITATEEAEISLRVAELKMEYGSIEDMPKQVIIDEGFARIKLTKDKYILFKRLPNSGIVILR